MLSKKPLSIEVIHPSAVNQKDLVVSTPKSRRDFIQQTFLMGMSLVVGCGTEQPVPNRSTNTSQPSPAPAEPNVPQVPTPNDACLDPFAEGEWLSNMIFTSDEDIPKNTPLGVGWDGRLYTDLQALDEDNLIIPNDDFYIRTRYPDQLNPEDPWAIDVTGLVGTPRQLTMADIESMVEPMGVHLLECSGNWQGGAFGLLSAAEWSGVPVMRVLDSLDIHPDATRVVIGGFDEHSVPSAGGHSSPGASWVFTFEDLARQGAFFATQMNGEVLPLDHGYPIRLIMPGWYGCTCIKWVNEIRLVDETEVSTSQMREFASRTHQNGTPLYARDFLPASMDQAAMPVRVEKWRVNDEIVYKVVGIMWGGYESTDSLVIRFGNSNWEPVTLCPPQTTNATWTLWTHEWKPSSVGDYYIALQISDPDIPTRRLDRGWYLRSIRIDEVSS